MCVSYVVNLLPHFRHCRRLRIVSASCFSLESITLSSLCPQTLHSIEKSKSCVLKQLFLDHYCLMTNIPDVFYHFLTFFISMNQSNATFSLASKRSLNDTTVARAKNPSLSISTSLPELHNRNLTARLNTWVS